MELSSLRSPSEQFEKHIQHLIIQKLSNRNIEVKKSIFIDLVDIFRVVFVLVSVQGGSRGGPGWAAMQAHPGSESTIFLLGIFFTTRLRDTS